MNNQIFFFFYNFAHQFAFFDKLVVFVADTLPYIVVLLAGLFLVLYLKILPSKKIFQDLLNRWKEICLILFSVGFAMIADKILKSIVHNPRPFLAFTNVQSLFPETGYAFPSGHATFFSALAFSIFFLNKKVGYVFMDFALLIGLARIISGVHFPIDILGGFILGGGTAYFIRFIFKKYLNFN